MKVVCTLPSETRILLGSDTQSTCLVVLFRTVKTFGFHFQFPVCGRVCVCVRVCVVHLHFYKGNFKLSVLSLYCQYRFKEKTRLFSLPQFTPQKVLQQRKSVWHRQKETHKPGRFSGGQKHKRLFLTHATATFLSGNNATVALDQGFPKRGPQAEVGPW